MELKTTIFAAFAVFVITIRNNKIAKLEGKNNKYDDIKPLFMQFIDTYKQMFKRIKEKISGKR